MNWMTSKPRLLDLATSEFSGSGAGFARTEGRTMLLFLPRPTVLPALPRWLGLEELLHEGDQLVATKWLREKAVRAGT